MMFLKAPSWNGDISKWVPSSAANMLNMFGQKVIGPCTINGINLGAGKKTGIACFNQTWCSKHCNINVTSRTSIREEATNLKDYDYVQGRDLLR